MSFKWWWPFVSMQWCERGKKFSANLLSIADGTVLISLCIESENPIH